MIVLKAACLAKQRLVHTQLPLVVAINWQRHRKEMLEKAFQGLSKNMLRIDHSFNKLITALTTPTSSPNNLEYDKEKTS